MIQEGPFFRGINVLTELFREPLNSSKAVTVIYVGFVQVSGIYIIDDTSLPLLFTA